MALEYLQGWRFHNLSGKPKPVLGHPQNEKVFLDVQREPPVLQFMPIAPCPVTVEKHLALCTLPSGIYIH